MEPTIKTARLTLRPVAVGDRPDLIALERDPEVMRFLNGGRATPDGIDPEADFLMPRGGEPGVWCARQSTDGAFVGWASLRVQSDGSAELGYRLRREAWGRGLAAEAASALVAHGFETLDLDRIVATTMAVNRGSRRVMEKVGLVHVDTRFGSYADPLPGAEEGDVVHELTRTAWLTQGSR